ncbi:peroxiredoxin-like family protein [Winogradskyella maritima]|uniref:thioredoxin-dependent peroxiredoxin n=1 Tax=Winogradskyella maritima TaxID=1517766 RepID=A0ABV8AID3_9FLAO|nr:peroxiredoxin-like family protein [Winogradskyella maritima]
MSLAETLLKANTLSRSKIPTETLAVMDKATNILVEEGISKQAIQIGEKFPKFVLKNAKSETISSSHLLKNGPLVISFYRGGWCPYCNIELKALQAALPEFKSKGANLVAISPETPDNSLSTAEKNELSFEVLTDEDNLLAKQIGLVFQLPKEIQSIYDNFGIDVAKHNENDKFELPVAATFVVNKDGIVTYRYVNEDYTKRAEISEIIEAL